MALGGAIIGGPASGINVDISLVRIFFFSCLAIGIQFGWALQLSLLTPYVQELGIPHTFASYIWLCGPISGMVVQPTVGYFSDRCKSRWGRRRPFILGGIMFIILAVLFIAFSADIGHRLGDPVQATRKPKAIVFYVLGFWLLDLANNTLMGPCRALMADYTGHSETRSRKANAFFTLFMALGNVMGYGTGAYSGWNRLFKFTNTGACDKACANLKSAFIIHIIVLVITSAISLLSVKEFTLAELRELKRQQELKDLESAANGNRTTSTVADLGLGEKGPTVREILRTVKDIAWKIRYIMLVMALTWIAWYPFTVYDTDWTGDDIYKGKSSTKDEHLKDLYNKGVRVGALGLMLNSIVLGCTSFVMEPLCRKIGASNVWGIGNTVMSLCFIGVVIVTKGAHKGGSTPTPGVLAATLVIFAFTGVTLAVTYTVPYIVTMNYVSSLGAGQGLSMGVLNQACVIPQLLMSFIVGPWDQLFGGGNTPAFVVGIVVSFIGALVAVFALPKLNCCRPDGHPDKVLVAPQRSIGVL